MDQAGYDIIGDIHGHADELIKLLTHLGYRESATGFCHPHRKVVFVGDFIDRGEHLRQHQALLTIVMAMVKNGHACSVMGNHEFNALAFHTRHNGEYLRPRTDKNIRQHQAFLNEFEHLPEQKQEVLDFFYSLPLWLELDGIRIVHACWDAALIEFMRTRCPDGHLDPALLAEASTKGEKAYLAVEQLLKGVEVALPDGIRFKDKDGHSRDAVRVQWWQQHARQLGEVALSEGSDIGHAASLPLPANLPRYPADQPPCFVGHYWMTGTPRPLTENVACLDYSVAKGGKLVAYRWSGETALLQAHFVYC